MFLPTPKRAMASDEPGENLPVVPLVLGIPDPVESLLQPSVTDGEGLMPGQLRAIIILVDRTPKHPFFLLAVSSRWTVADLCCIVNIGMSLRFRLTGMPIQ